MRLRKSTKANNRLPKGGFHVKLWPTMEGYDRKAAGTLARKIEKNLLYTPYILRV